MPSTMNRRNDSLLLATEKAARSFPPREATKQLETRVLAAFSRADVSYRLGLSDI